MKVELNYFAWSGRATSWQRSCCRKVAEWCVKFLFAGTISTPLNLAWNFSIVAKIKHLLVDKPRNYWAAKWNLNYFRVKRSKKDEFNFTMKNLNPFVKFSKLLKGSAIISTLFSSCFSFSLLSYFFPFCYCHCKGSLNGKF